MDEIDDDRTPERKRLDAWSAENPRDQLGMVALAAWLNTTPDKLPKEMRLHTCQATKDAWARVEVAIRADLDQAPAPVRVKPLVWEVCALPRHHENKWVAGPYTIRFVEDFFLVYGWDDKFKHTSVDLDDAQAAAQADYSARILAALETPDAGVVAELVEALRGLMALGMSGHQQLAAHQAGRAVLEKLGAWP